MDYPHSSCYYFDYLDEQNSVCLTPTGINLTTNGTFTINGDSWDSPTLNTSVNSTYGSMYNYSSTGWTFYVPTHGVYYNMTNFTAGETNDMTVTDSKLIVQTPGVYQIGYGFTFAGGATVYAMAIGVNGDVQRNCYAQRKISNVGDVGNAGTECMLLLSENDEISFMVEDETNPASDITVQAISITAEKMEVGNLEDNNFWQESEGYTNLKSTYDQDVWLKGGFIANGSVTTTNTPICLGYNCKANIVSGTAVGYGTDAGALSTVVGVLASSSASLQTVIGYGDDSSGASQNVCIAGGNFQCVQPSRATIGFGTGQAPYISLGSNNITISSQNVGVSTDQVNLDTDMAWVRRGNVSAIGYCNETGGNCIDVDGFSSNSYGYNGTEWLPVNATSTGSLRVTII